jgi:hypothetical protein
MPCPMGTYDNARIVDLACQNQLSIPFCRVLVWPYIFKDTVCLMRETRRAARSAATTRAPIPVANVAMAVNVFFFSFISIYFLSFLLSPYVRYFAVLFVCCLSSPRFSRCYLVCMLIGANMTTSTTTACVPKVSGTVCGQFDCSRFMAGVGSSVMHRRGSFFFFFFVFCFLCRV